MDEYIARFIVGIAILAIYGWWIVTFRKNYLPRQATFAIVMAIVVIAIVSAPIWHRHPDISGWKWHGHPLWDGRHEH